MKVNLLSDNELVIKFASGDNSALEKLVLRHQKKIFGYIFTIVNDRDIAEDIFQDAFVKVIKTIRTGRYNDEGKFINWVMRISHNLCIDYFRKEKNFPTVSSGDDYDIFDLICGVDHSKEDQIIVDQIHKDIRSLIELLPDDQREVVIMRYFQNMSFKEISEETNVSINTSLGRMRYALINLRKMIAEKNIVLSL